MGIGQQLSKQPYLMLAKKDMLKKAPRQQRTRAAMTIDTEILKQACKKEQPNEHNSDSISRPEENLNFEPVQVEETKTCPSIKPHPKKWHKNLIKQAKRLGK